MEDATSSPDPSLKPTTLAKYQAWVGQTAFYPPGLNYPVATLASESGECMGEVVKAMRAKHALDIQPWDLSPALRERLLKELSDTLWALCACANEFGISLQDLADINFDKLEERRLNGDLYQT